MPKIVMDADVFRSVMQVITERGYAGATTRQMAEAAGVSEVTLFRKYGSKAHLVKQAVAELASQLDFASAIHYTGDVSADLLRVVQKYEDAAVHFGHFFVALLPEVQRYPELIEIVGAPLGILKSVAQLLARYQEQGDLRQEDPLHAATALLGPLLYTSMLRGAASDVLIPPLDLQNLVVRYLEGHRSDSAIRGDDRPGGSAQSCSKPAVRRR
jgi:AcrR family transcriptional regulator